jgi:hypothetical protein
MTRAHARCAPHGWHGERRASDLSGEEREVEVGGSDDAQAATVFEWEC